MAEGPASSGAFVRMLMLRRRRSRVPWVYLVYHRVRGQPGAGLREPDLWHGIARHHGPRRFRGLDAQRTMRRL
jgi:hypothetical protein